MRIHSTVPSVGASAFTGKFPPNCTGDQQDFRKSNTINCRDYIPACGTGLTNTDPDIPCEEAAPDDYTIWASARSQHNEGVNAAMGDSRLRAQLLIGLSIALYYREGERERGLERVRDSVAISRRLADTGLLATALVELIVMLDAAPSQTEQQAAAAELAALDAGDLPRETASGATLRLARLALTAGDSSRLERDAPEHRPCDVRSARHGSR